MIATLVDVFAGDSVLLVFVVMAAAATLGAVRFKGVALGPAAALFVGLGIGAIDKSLSGAARLTQLRELGLALFAHTLGLASGPAFFGGLRRGGLRAAALTVALIGSLAGACPVAARVLDLATELALRRDILDSAGMLAGIETQPAALAYINERTSGDERVNQAYALVFPVAMIAKIIIVQFLA